MNDEGHMRLIADLKDILGEAEAFQFHDFRNEKYATPKMELVNRLTQIANRARNGDYDNMP